MDSITRRVAARYKGKKVTEEGNTVYLYSERQIQNRNRKKAERLEKLSKNIHKLRAQVKKDLKSEDTATRMTALAVALIDHTFERVGNEESAEEGHFGVTGWQKSHISFGKGKATIKYVGKSGVKQEKHVTDSDILPVLRKAYEECEDGLFSSEGCKVDATKVNSYLKDFDVTAKDLRGFHANREMKDNLKTVRKGTLPSDKKDREKKLKEEWKEALELTAKAVGHEPSTLKSQYLVPGLYDAYMKDGSIPEKMKIAATHRLDLAWVESLRKDFLTLMKNLPKVKDYSTAIRLKEAFGIFRKNFDELIFKTFLEKDLKYNLGLLERDKEYIDKKLRASGWSLSIELVNFPLARAGKYETEESALVKFKQEVSKWEARMRRAAQTFWKDMKEVISWFEGYYSKPLDVRTPTIENARLEGFTVVMQGYQHEDEYHRDALELLKEGLRLYRKRASVVAPILLKKQVPIQMEFKTTLDQGGQYIPGTQTILFFVSSLHSHGHLWVAHVLAHEMGHHLWRTLLSADAKEFWEQTIKGDFGDLDVADLVANWPGEAWAFDMSRYLGNKDPVLALQVEALTHDRSYEDLQRKEDFQALLDRGVRTLRTPKTPITGYANKSPEEAFCEAIGVLVGYGPRVLHERVRMWLETTMPGAVKVASVAHRVATRFLSSG